MKKCVTDKIKTITEIGCGRADFTEYLNKIYQYYDYTDLSICMNTLHHIKPEDLNIAITELERITKKYILIKIKNLNDI